MDFGQRGRRGGRGRGFGGGFRRDGGFDDNRNRSDSSNWRSQNSDGVSSSENDTTKMYVEENCVGRIIGRGGSKIRELQDSSGANIKVNRNETEGGKVLVVVKGSADARTQAEDMIKELTESFNGLSAGNNRGGGGRSGWGRSSEDTWGSSAGQTGNGEETLGSSSETTDIYVDPSCVGRIIGKGGSKIRELQDESGANIKVNRNETEGGKVLVVVTGSADARTQAEDMIKELTESFNDSSGYRGGGGGGGRSSDWDFNDGNADSVGNGEETFGSSSETTDIYVDPSCVGRIIGKGGSKIRELQDESGANIKVNRNETEGGKVLVVVTGSADARTQAEDMIKELTESFNDSSGYRGGGGGGGRSSDWDFNDGNADSVGNGEETLGSSSETTDIYVDPSCVGRIIGKGGSKIRELQDESGANIKVNRNETEGGKVLVVVTGSADARTQAEDMIKELTESFNDSSGYRGGGGGGGRSSDWDFNDGNADSVGNGEKTRMFNNKGSSSETTEIHVDQSCVGRIIGRGGSKIQDLQDESGAKIKVTRNETEEGKIIVVLTGSADARTQAEDMIKELTESCFDSSSSYRGGGGGRSTGWGSTDDNAGNGEETEKPKINWGIIRAAKEANEAKKFEGLPPLEKNFYFEDPDVANMHPGEVKEIRKKNNNIIVEGGEKRVPNPVRTFEEAFQHYPEILQQIYNQKFVEPSPIQKQAWPILLQGLDLIGIAQTGTGKTLAFLLPALIHIDNQPVPREQRGGPNVLVLSPTRELAQQIEVEVKKINYRGIRSVVVYGGGNRRSQINVVTRGVEIIVATPGRLNDLIMNGIVDVKSVTYLVLDEADRMLDMGFEPEIRKILLDIRRDRQTVMTSATWPQDVQRLADMYMSSPINIFVGTLDLAACHSVTQLVEMLDDEEKKPRLFEFLQYELQPIDKVIVFVGKKVLADDLSSDLAMEGVECQCIHGDREQCDREAALSDFKSGAVRILIATDVASRGLDVKDITHVLNYDFPRNIEEYVHRIGRTGRAGNTGTSITFITRGDWRQAQKLIDIMAEADQEIPDILIKMAERYQAHRERVAQEGGGFGGRGGRGGRGRGGGFGGGRRGGGGFGGGGGGGEDDGFFSGGFGRGAFRGGGGRGRRDKEYDIHMGW